MRDLSCNWRSFQNRKGFLFMRTFRVYRHSNASVAAVKVGFSWPCFVFGVLWAAVKRLWALVANVIGLILLSHFIEEIAYNDGSDRAGMAVSAFLNVTFGVGWLVFSFMANGYREKILRARGYQLVATVKAESPLAAEGVAIGPEYDGAFGGQLPG